MQTEFADVEKNAREIESEIRRRLTGKATKVADVLGWSDSTMSRWKDRDLAEVAKILACLGFSFVDTGKDGVTISADDYQVLRVLAERHTKGFFEGLPKARS